jgi:hypothetical protein
MNRVPRQDELPAVERWPRDLPAEASAGSHSAVYFFLADFPFIRLAFAVAFFFGGDFLAPGFGFAGLDFTALDFPPPIFLNIWSHPAAKSSVEPVWTV